MRNVEIVHERKWNILKVKEDFEFQNFLRKQKKVRQAYKIRNKGLNLNGTFRSVYDFHTFPRIGKI